MSTAFEMDEENTYYTYADYLSWETDKRYEIIDGAAYMMSAPLVVHQAISRELLGQFWAFLKGKPCQVFAAPFDVRLFPKEDGSDDTVVQPDLLVICDKTKIADGKACRGAPDLVIEILSPSNTPELMFLKFNNYLRAGVREYWVIEPEQKGVQVHTLEPADEKSPARYVSTAYSNDESLGVSILPGLTIDLNSIWSAL
jgi:Uma2 family endonuclease